MKSKKLLLSDLAVLCSCILSHPLYLSYFLFFSPYLVKLLGFLSPLFITTTLLLLSLLTSIHPDSSTFSTLLENLVQVRFNTICDESPELEGFEEFQVYKIVFGFPTFDLVSEFSQEKEEDKVLGVLISDDNFQESPLEFPIGEEEEEKILGVLISDERGFPAKGGDGDGFAGKRQDDETSDELLAQETGKCEKLTSGVGKAGEWKQKIMTDKKLGQVLTPSSINGGNQTQQRPVIKTHSTWRGDGHSPGKKHDYYSYSSSQSHSQPISPSLSDLGSMRKEKEWRRTLACKLFEERHNAGGSEASVGGVEGMDLLWETYEKTEENRGKQCSHWRNKEKKTKKGRVADYVEEYGAADEDQDEEEVDNGQLCCLQALKFSAGKMNFGRPGFLKISKAIKGIGVGWLSHHNHHRQHHQHSGGSNKGKRF